MTRSTDLAVLSRVAERRQGPFTGTPNLSMNGEKGAFADWWLSYRAELWFKLKMSRYDLTDFE
jgi:hypothetical protein